MENHSEKTNLEQENKRLLDILKDSENQRIKERFLLQKLDLFNENTPMAVIDWDLNSCVTGWNKSAEAIFGYSQSEAIGKCASELIIPDSVKELTDKIWHLLFENRGGARATNENIRKDGKSIVCDWYNIPISNNEGNVIGVSSMALDITEKVKAEQYLDESNARFKMLSELTFEGILVHKNGIAIEVNSSLERITLYNRNEIIGKNIIDHFIAEEFISTVQEKIKNNSVSPYEIKLKRKDGKLIWVEFEAKNILYLGEEIRAVAIRDIQLRKHNELVQKIIYEISEATNITENFDEFINQIQKLLANIIDAKHFFIWTKEENETGFQLLQMTSKLSKVNDPDAEIALSEYVILNKEPLLLKKEQILDLSKSGEINIVDTIIENWIGVPLISKGEIIGVLGIQNYDNPNAFTKKDMEILSSVSHQVCLSIERKRSESELRKALFDAQESNRLKSTFLSTISHELRTPLNAVIGFSDLIDESMEIEEAASLSKLIFKSGNNLLDILNDIFDLSVLEDDTMVLFKEKHNIHVLLDEIKEFIIQEKRKMDKDDLIIIFKLNDENNDLQINTDPKRFKQIFVHLLKNALKYTKDGFIEVGYNILPNEIKFYVKDTGIGIAKEKQKHIFELFRQLDDRHTREYQGVGIGLSIAKKMCENLGGELKLESELAMGSTFYFTFPYENEKLENYISPNKALIDLSILNGKTILIAEDETSNFELLQLYLRPFKSHVLWAKNGLEAIDIFLANKYIDIILMDIKMPILSGYHAAKEIRIISPTVPIIAQTAFAMNSEKEIAIEAGCNDYISKPINWKILSEKMALHLYNK